VKTSGSGTNRNYHRTRDADGEETSKHEQPTAIQLTSGGGDWLDYTGWLLLTSLFGGRYAGLHELH